MMHTVWSEEVEQLAAENMKRCAEIADCKAQIAKWKQKLKKLQNEHRVKAQFAEVRRNPAHWNRLKKNEKFRKELVEIVLSSTSRTAAGREHEIPSLLRDWKQVPTSLRNDPDLFLLRLEKSPPIEYFPLELVHNRPIVEKIFKSQPCLLLGVGSASHIWSDRDYYKLFLEHNDVTNQETNKVLLRFHFEVRNDSDLILSLTQSDQAWQGLLKPSTCCFHDRVPGHLLWKNKKDVAIHILRQSNSLRYFSTRLRDDPDIVKVALEKWGGQLVHASPRLRRKNQMISIACHSHPAAILYALKRPKKRYSPQEAARIFETAGSDESIGQLCYKFWRDLPESLRCNKTVALAACRHILPIDEKSLPPSVIDRSFWEKVIDQNHPNIIDCIPMSDVWGYDLIPNRFQTIGDAVCWRERSSFRGVANPAFWLAIARSGFLLEGHVSGLLEIPNFVVENKDIMVELCRKDGDILLALDGTPLAVDRDILQAALQSCPTALSFMGATAQHMHPDLVAGAIRGIQDPAELWVLFDDIDEDLWVNRDIALAWLEAGGDYLQDEFDEEFEDSEEIFLSVAKYCPQDFWYASDQLCSNKDFMLQVVKINPILLKEASSSLRLYYDLGLAAFGFGPNLPGAFDANNQVDFDYLTTFASKVREDLLLHRSFFATLMGMHDSRSSSCLAVLDQDAETSGGLKKIISSFLGIPLGEHLHTLRCTSLHLAQWGF